MKQFLKTILYSLCITNALLSHAFEYAENSVLATGNWAKIRVAESGICKLTFEEIRNMGFSNPSEIRIFGYGGAALSENFVDPSFPRIDDLNELPIYAGDGYYLFYAQGPIRWYFQPFVEPYMNFATNPYSSYGYYFITDNIGRKRRISDCGNTTNPDLPTSDIRNYLDAKAHKKEDFNFIASGKIWYGDKISPDTQKTFDLSFKSVDKDSSAVVLIKCASSSESSSQTSVNVQIGDTTLSSLLTFDICSHNKKATEKNSYYTAKPSSGKISVSLKYSAGNLKSFGAVERILVNLYRPLSMGGEKTIFFRNPATMRVQSNYTYHIGECNSNIEVWDISDRANPQKVSTQLSGDTLLFSATADSVLHEYVAVDVKNPKCISAEYVGKVSNQNLHAEKPADMVVVAHEDFLAGAEEIAQLHRDYDQMDVLVTTPDQIYNEFSSGAQDATAIRWFMKKMYDQNGKQPFHLLLIGDGCYDNRALQATKTTKINNYIVTYQGGSSTDGGYTFAADDYFAFMDDEDMRYGKTNLAKTYISVGRIPCSTTSELNGFIKKIAKHLENKNYGKWKNQVVLLADDNELSTNYHSFCKYSDNIAKKVQTYNNAMEVKKIYLDAYTRTTGSNGSRYYDVEKLIEEEVGKGVMIMNYIGHSSKIGFSAEHVFTQNKAASIYNENLGFWFTASCEFTQFDDLDRSGGEDLILNPNGGAIGLISSSRIAYENANDNLNQAFFTHLFSRDEDGMPMRIGDVLRLAKFDLSNDSNKLAFNLMGDPALRLHYPTQWVMTDSIIEADGTPTDSMKALSEKIIYGRIANNRFAVSDCIEDFNGTLFITLYDKEGTFYTKANIYTEEQDIIKNRYTYTDRTSVLFSGQVEVRNGRFTAYLKIPKDINYSYGKGRLAYYAYDEEHAYEAQGAYEDFIVGGSSNNISLEKDGPEVKLFMNTPKFHSGGKVNNSPVFYALVSDPNGINASGVGIGHDITLTLNGDKTPIVLNNYFSYSKDSYTDGVVMYQLSDLQEGSYTLTFKVWDLLNNSTTQSITFTVDNDVDVELEDIIAYPNPAKETITFVATQTFPMTIQTFRFLLYDINGRIVYKSDETTVKNDGTWTWTWDLRTQNGRRVDAGSYIGRIEIESDGEKYTGKSKKIIVLPQ